MAEKPLTTLTYKEKNGTWFESKSGMAGTQKAERRARLRAAPEATLVDERPSSLRHVREAWRERRLVPALSVRVITRVFAGAKLGRTWLFIRPLMDTFGKALIYGGVLGAPSAGAVPYVIFLIVGMAGWMLFQRSLMFATRSLTFYRRLIKDFNFPMLLVPVASSGLAVIEFFIYVGILACTVGYYYWADGVMYLNLGLSAGLGFVGLAGCLAFSWALGTWLAVLNAFAQDVRMTLRYVVGFWLYLTPIIYPLEAIPPQYQTLASLNPMTPWIEMVKLGFLGEGDPRFLPLVSSVCVLLVVGISGIWYFNKNAERASQAEEELVGMTEEEEM